MEPTFALILTIVIIIIYAVLLIRAVKFNFNFIAAVYEWLFNALEWISNVLVNDRKILVHEFGRFWRFWARKIF